MKKVINGKMYDTTTAKVLAEFDSGHPSNDFQYYAETLYIKKTGEYFLYGWGGGSSKYGEWRGNSGGAGESIRPLTLKEAKEWAEERLDGEEYEKIFGEVEETAESAEPNEQMSLLLPAAMLANLRAKKADTGITVSALIIKALREAGY